MQFHRDELLQAIIDEGGSDLHIRARMAPELRVHGELLPLHDEVMNDEEAEALVHEFVQGVADQDKDPRRKKDRILSCHGFTHFDSTRPHGSIRQIRPDKDKTQEMHLFGQPRQLDGE